MNNEILNQLIFSPHNKSENILKYKDIIIMEDELDDGEILENHFGWSNQIGHFINFKLYDILYNDIKVNNLTYNELELLNRSIKLKKLKSIING